jgi:transposase
MSTQTVPNQRQQFYTLHLQGHTYAEIAERLGVSKMCVRFWCRRLRDGKGAQTIYPKKPSGLLSRFHPQVRYVILRLRLEHSRWGPNRCSLRVKQVPT